MAPNRMTVPNWIRRLNQLNNLVDAHLAPSFPPRRMMRVVDEKFTAQNEEQDDAGDDIGGVVIEVELGGDLNGALLQKTPAGRRSGSSQRC